MKFKASALAVTAIAAIGLASSVIAAETSYDKLVFATNQIYTMTASGTTVTTVGGEWNATLTAVDSKVEIDSDAELPLRFAPASGDAKAATELKFNVEASVVPNSVTLSVPSDANAPQCGFAIKETIVDNVVSTNFHVFTGSAWTKVEAGVPAIPAAGTMFDLTVKLDYRSGIRKAQYWVDGVALGDGAWYSIKSGSTKVSGIDFVGNGYLSGLRGDVLTVVSEIIVINPGLAGQFEVTFSESQMEALKTAVGGDASKVSEKLSSSTAQANDLTPFDNYVLLGKIKDSDVAATDKPVVKADPSATPSAVNNVVVKVPLFNNVQTVGGVDVTHVLKGSANGTDGWNQVGEAKKGNEPQFEIPANSTYRYFKVETTVSPTGK